MTKSLRSPTPSTGAAKFLVALICAACSGDQAPGAAPGGDGGRDGRADAKARLDANSAVDAKGRTDATQKGDARLDGKAVDGRVTADAVVRVDGSRGGDAGGSCMAQAVMTCTCSQGVGTARCLPDGSSWGACTCSTYGTEFYVSPTGSDTAAGTLTAPFKTLDRAQTAVRALTSSLPAGGVVVWLRGGVYPRTTTFALASADSGSAGAPVVYRGYPGETARLVGGVTLEPSAFQIVTSASSVWNRLDTTAQGVVVALDLSSAGITDYGTLLPRSSFEGAQPAALELFIDGNRAPLARWPDADVDQWTPPPSVNATEVTVYGTGITPDVAGTYLKDSVQDGVSSFTRQGQVNGQTYHLYRTRGTNNGAAWVGWFLSTSASGYPASTDTFFYTYEPTLGPLAPGQNATGTPVFASPTAIVHGFVSVATVDKSNNSLTLQGNRAARWVTAPDPWVHSYLSQPWVDEHIAVSNVDAATGAITLKTTPFLGLSALLTGGGSSEVYGENLLEEITEPGEWYLDRTSGILYVWPPTNFASHDLVASVLSAPLVSVTGASNVVLQELTFEATRTELVQIEGASTNVSVVGCTLRDSGQGAASIADGSNNLFDGDLVYATGEEGIDLGGGDRASLTKANNVVQNSVIHDFSEWVWTYTPAVNLTGDGNVVQHNVMFGAPHSAILFDSSSEQTIEYNDIHDVLKFSSDAGAIYAWGDWGSYGNVVRYNFIHDITSELSGYGIHGVYLDNCLSGPDVSSNVLYNFAGSAIFHNGGHDVTMTNNLVVGCNYALETTSACVADNSPDAGPICAASPYLLQELVTLDYQENPWASTFPSCAAIPDSCTTVTAHGSHWLTPYGTTFTDNVIYETGALFLSDSPTTISSYAAFDDNLDGGSPLIVSIDAGDFNLQPGSPALALPGFVAIPFDSIGLQH